MTNLDSSKSFLPINLLFGVAVVVTIVAGWFGWFTFKSTDDLVSFQLRNQKIIELQGTVTHYDEVLTMSARMAAATGDAKWESRYRQFEPSLDQAIKMLISLQPIEIKAAEETDLANLRLVQMENKAFLLIQKNNQAEASLVLSSKEYKKQKEIYAHGTADFHKNTNDTLDREWKGHRTKAQILKAVLFLFLGFSVLGWIVVILRVRQWNKVLKQINLNLDQKVNEQTAILINASKMSALGEMAGGIAHEISSPLAVIQMKSEQLKESAEINDLKSSEVIETADEIASTVIRIAKIISGLRSFSRDGRGDPFELSSLQTILEETLHFCKEKFKNNNTKLNVQMPANPLKIECRPTQISQVLLNLINNAYDAIRDANDKWVTVELVDTGEYIEISVTDSGQGIPTEIREKIMQPFFTTKEVGKGTGLGLSISCGIIFSHKGKLTVDSKSQHTRFVITLPKSQKPEEMAA